MVDEIKEGTKIVVINSAECYNNRFGVVEQVEGGVIWNSSNERIYKVKLEMFRGYLWFNRSELITKEEYEEQTVLVAKRPLVDWLSK